MLEIFIVKFKHSIGNVMTIKIVVDCLFMWITALQGLIEAF